MSKLLPNYYRMFALIDEVFATRLDPDQLQVDEAIITKLNQLHPACLSELADENGPVIWALMFPTTRQIMDDFLSGKIPESALLQDAPPEEKLTCLYLCSVTTLPEKRGKGETKKICLKAIRAICKDYPIKTLFVWAFTKEGQLLAESLKTETGLELRMR